MNKKEIRKKRTRIYNIKNGKKQYQVCFGRC